MSNEADGRRIEGANSPLSILSDQNWHRGHLHTSQGFEHDM
jgi:hypothetical protein